MMALSGDGRLAMRPSEGGPDLHGRGRCKAMPLMLTSARAALLPSSCHACGEGQWPDRSTNMAGIVLVFAVGIEYQLLQGNKCPPVVARALTR